MLNVDEPNQSVDNSDNLGQRITKIIELFLEWGRLRDLRSNALVNVSNGGIRTCKSDNRNCMSSSNSRSRENHVDLILLDSVLVLDCRWCLSNTLTLASQD